MDQSMIADSVVSLSAFCGLIVLIVTITLRGRTDHVSRQLKSVLYLLAALMVLRALAWTIGGEWLALSVNLVAGFLPLFLLLLTESLLRRHAPKSIKILIAGATLWLTLSAILPNDWTGILHVWSLFVAQFFSFAACGWLIIRRDKDGFSSEENRAITRLALSLLLILPLIASEFRGTISDIGLRMGGIAILFLCWLALSLGRSQSNHRDAGLGLAVIALVTTIETLVIRLPDAEPGYSWIQLAGMLLAINLVLVILMEGFLALTARRGRGLLRHASSRPMDDLNSFLFGLADHSAIEGAMLLQEKDLTDFNKSTLERLVTAHPILHHSMPMTLDHHPAEEQEQINWLFERFAATHILAIETNPLQLLALNMPAISASSSAELELQVFQRMLGLIARQNKNNEGNNA